MWRRIQQIMLTVVKPTLYNKHPIHDITKYTIVWFRHKSTEGLVYMLAVRIYDARNSWIICRISWKSTISLRLEQF